MHKKHQGEFAFLEQNGPSKKYEYSVLVTSLLDDLPTLAQHYRDRSDSENNFDELKNQWGWGGYTTKDLKRCRLMSKVIALIYNWWTLFARLAKGEKHLEAITSYPLLLNGIGKLTRHSGQKHLKLSSTHGRIKEIQLAIKRLMGAFDYIKQNAEQLNPYQRWCHLLSTAFAKFLNGRKLWSPDLLST